MLIQVIKLLLLLTLTGCASITITSNTSPEGEFDRYQTFYCRECQDELNREVPRYDNLENRELIRQAIQAELEERGYFYSQESPDLFADFHVVIEERSEIIEEAYPMGWQRDEFMSFPINYQYGTLIVRLTDRNTNQLVWQGTASKVLENPKNAGKTIEKAINRIFKN